MLPMNNAAKWSEAMLNLARYWIETGTKNLEIFQEQTTKAMDHAMSTADRLKTETQSAYDEWRRTAEQACRIYAETLENGLSILSSALGQADDQPQTKTKKEPR